MLFDAVQRVIYRFFSLLSSEKLIYKNSIIQLLTECVLKIMKKFCGASDANAT